MPSSVGDFENSVFSKLYVLPAKYIYIFTFFIYFWYVVRVFFFFFFLGGVNLFLDYRPQRRNKQDK